MRLFRKEELWSLTFFFEGKQILYCEMEGVYNLELSVRGGIPVLFPIAGRVSNDSYTLEGVTYPMYMHGIARKYAWDVIDTYLSEEKGSITLSLKSNDQIKKFYPFDFELQYCFELNEKGFTLRQTYINSDNKPMPIGTGFHPYFMTSNKEGIRLSTGASKCYDAVQGGNRNYCDQIDFSVPEVDVILLDPSKECVAFENRADGWNASLKYDDEFKYIVIWSCDGKDYVCVEPWMALPGALDTKDDLMWLEGGKEKLIVFSIECEKEFEKK